MVDALVSHQLHDRRTAHRHKSPNPVLPSRGVDCFVRIHNRASTLDKVAPWTAFGVSLPLKAKHDPSTRLEPSQETGNQRLLIERTGTHSGLCRQLVDKGLLSLRFAYTILYS